MSDIEADQLLRVADDDVSMARIALSGSTPVLTGAAYHAQQAAEKATKAALKKLGIGYSRTHNIGTLAASLPAGHPFANLATQLVTTTPWATQSRYEMITPPSAREIVQALQDTEKLKTEVARSLPSPQTNLAVGLSVMTPAPSRAKRLVATWVNPKLIADALAAPSTADAPEVVAFRVIAETSVHQVEYDLTTPDLKPTGRTLYDWDGALHVRDLLRTGSKSKSVARLYLNVLKLDEAVQANVGLAPAFEALLKFNQGLQPPENPPPSPKIDAGRSGP